MLQHHPLVFFENHKLSIRPQQKHVVETVDSNWNKYKYFIVNAPTGVGKTYITCSIADRLSGRAYILTSTLQLQDQYETSWKKIVNLKGRGNYQCNVNPNFTVDAAPCSANDSLKKDCMINETCAYYNQKHKALRSQAMITNPLFLLYSAHCGFAKDGEEAPEQDENGWVAREAMIVDEAHNLEQHLVSFAETKIDPELIAQEHSVNLKGIKFTGDMAKDYELLQVLKGKLEQKAGEYKEKLDTEFPQRGSTDNFSTKSWARGFDAKIAEKVKKLNAKIYSLDKAIQPLNIFFGTHKTVEELQRRWLIHADVDANTIQLSPITADFLFHEYFGRLADKFIFMSATLGTKAALCAELGIPEEQALYIEVDTPFAAEKSPIIATPMLDLTYSNKRANIPKIGPIVDMILEEHKAQRGIIHSATYEFGGEVYKQVSQQHRDRLLYKDMEVLDGSLSGKPSKYGRRFSNTELLQMHSEGEKHKHSVLVSPSMMEGVDLFDDLSEFQIILKMPWASLADPRVKQKKNLNGDWYVNKVWISIMQASGRSTRHESDESVTYILDESFPRSFKAWKHMLPKWFTSRVILDS